MKILQNLLLCLLVSCTGATELLESEPVRLKIELEVPSLSRARVLPAGAEIGLFIVESENAEELYYGETKYKNIRAIKTIDGWELDQEVILKTNPAKVLAYYPYQKNLTEMRIPLDSEVDRDFLFGQGETEVSESSPSVLIRMQSPFTIARFWLRQSAPGSSVFATELRIRNIDPALTSLCTRGNVNLPNQSINPDVNGTHVSVIDDQGYMWFTDQYMYVDFFVFPCRMRFAEIIFEAKIDNRYYNYLIEPATWMPGKANEYYLTFTNN